MESGPVEAAGGGHGSKGSRAKLSGVDIVISLALEVLLFCSGNESDTRCWRSETLLESLPVRIYRAKQNRCLRRNLC